jgi:hypothetical protein
VLLGDHSTLPNTQSHESERTEVGEYRTAQPQSRLQSFSSSCASMTPSTQKMAEGCQTATERGILEVGMFRRQHFYDSRRIQKRSIDVPMELCSALKAHPKTIMVYP